MNRLVGLLCSFEGKLSHLIGILVIAAGVCFSTLRESRYHRRRRVRGPSVLAFPTLFRREQRVVLHRTLGFFASLISGIRNCSKSPFETPCWAGRNELAQSTPR